MRHKTLALIALFASLALNCGAHAQQSERSAPRSPSWNDNSLITVQKNGGDPTRSGDVKIEFYGHDAFKITSPDGLTVLTDPWRNDPSGQYPKWFLNEFPAVQVDIVLSTHAHFDHDAVERPKGVGREPLPALAGLRTRNRNHTACLLCSEARASCAATPGRWSNTRPSSFTGQLCGPEPYYSRLRPPTEDDAGPLSSGHRLIPGGHV